MCFREHGHAETHVRLRGNPRLPGPKVKPGVPVMLGQPTMTFTTGLAWIPTQGARPNKTPNTRRLIWIRLLVSS